MAGSEVSNLRRCGYDEATNDGRVAAFAIREILPGSFTSPARLGPTHRRAYVPVHSLKSRHKASSLSAKSHDCLEITTILVSAEFFRQLALLTDAAPAPKLPNAGRHCGRKVVTFEAR
jgi:hypothetical protein